MIPKRRTPFEAAAAVLTVAVTALSSLAFAPSKPVSSAIHVAPAEVALDMGLLHAAALSTARSAGDTLDAPFLWVTVFGSDVKQASQQIPSAGKRWSIRLNEAKAAASLGLISVAPGDSVRVLFTLLEGDQSSATDEATASNALGKLKLRSDARSLPENSASVAATLNPLTKKGTHWIGSATMLLTNENGKTYWRAMDCISTCSVLNSPVQGNGSELAVQSAEGLSAVLELTGNAATYHLKVTAKRSK